MENTEKRRVFTRYLIVMFSCFILIACGEIEKITTDSNEILTVLYDTLAIPAPFPTLPKNYTKEDSIRIHNSVQEYRGERKNRTQVVAIYPFLISGANVDYAESGMNRDFQELLVKLKGLKEEKPLRISEIKTERKDSIIASREELLKEDTKDFINFDLLITFSRIAFNENKNKAALIASSLKSRLAGFSAAYFFKKENNRWVLVESIVLSIS